jgi:hypothetical protein
MSIEVAADEAAPEGGRAKLVLRGVWGLPPQVTYRIVCLDHSRVVDPRDWPQGERTPVETRPSPDGIELIIGPDIVDAPALAAGVPVRIVVPAVGLEQELFWPNLPTSVTGVSGPTVLASVDDLLAAAAAREGASAVTAVTPAAVAAEAAAPVAVAPQKTIQIANAIKTTQASDSLTTRTTRAPAAVKRPETSETTSRFAAVSPAVAFSAGALLSLLAVAVLGMALRGSPPAGRAPAPSSQPTATASLADVLTVGTVSPRGRSAEGVDLETLLDLADFNLHNDISDLEEAKFWLRRALREAVGNERLTWAMTQLGRTYARSEAASREQDLATARLLWSLSGGIGDHVANCFLHMVYDRGIGVPRDAAVAIRYQDAARAGGACQPDASSGDKATFTDGRRLPAGGVERTDAVAADIREWAQERQEMKRALSDAYVRHKQDADKLATLEAEMKLKKDEIARLVADLDERMKSIQSWSSNHSELTGRLAEAKREQARLTAALAAERESRAVAETQRVNSDEQDAFNAALNTARRLAVDAAQKSK